MTIPPRVATQILAWRLPRDDRDEVLGDLAEDFSARMATGGPRAARRWYRREALRLAWSIGHRHRDLVAARRSTPMTWDDLRYAVRRSLRHPWTSLAAVVTMAFAIGAAAATWSLLSAALLHPLALPQAERLLAVGHRYGRSPTLSMAFTYPAFAGLRDAGIFEDVAASGTTDVPIVLDNATDIRLVAFTSPNYFRLLGLSLQIGRGFSASDDRRGAPLVAIVSDEVWRRAFGGARDAIGKTVRMQNAIVTIVGVAPAGFRGIDLGEAPDFYLPLNTIGDVFPSGVNWFAEPTAASSPTAWVNLTGLLRAGQTIDAARTRLVALGGPAFPHRGLDAIDIETAALAEAARPDMREFARLLGATVGLLLLIGCLAVGMLLLLRTEARRNELAVCLALGANRARLGAGIVCEGAMLSGIGATLAIPVSRWLLAGARTFQLPGGIEVSQLALDVDSRTLVVALLAALVATLLMTTLAAGFGLSASVADALQARAGTTPRRAHQRTRSALVVAQVAIALVLLAGAGLFERSLAAALTLNPGYDTSKLSSGWISIRRPTPEATRAAFEALRDRLTQGAGVLSGALISQDGAMSAGGKLVIDGQPRVMPSMVSMTRVDDRYFSTMGLAIQHGRNFTEADVADAPRVTIVSASFGRFIANGGSPIGHHIQASMWRIGQAPGQIEVVGVVPDVITNVRRLDPLVMYEPLAQGEVGPNLMAVLHIASPVEAVERSAAAVAHEAAPLAPIPTFTTIDEQLASQMGPQRFGAIVMGALGMLAAALTFVSLFVVVESTATVRRREMGVRAALGATRPQLSGLLLRETTVVVAAGIVAGLGLAWLGAGLIRSFLFKVAPFDPATLGIVVAALVAMSAIVSVRPAIDAGRVDPASVLREP